MLSMASNQSFHGQNDSFDGSMDPPSLSRFESDDFAQSGFGDFDDNAPSQASALDKKKQHFDWGKAKMVRMMSEATLTTDETHDLTEDEEFWTACDTTVMTESSYHSACTMGSNVSNVSNNSNESNDSSSSKKKKKKSSKRSSSSSSSNNNSSSSSSNSKLREGKSIKSSNKETRSTLSSSTKKSSRRRSMGEIPEHEVIHDTKTTHRSSASTEGNESQSQFDMDFSPPPMGTISKVSREFDKKARNRRISIPTYTTSDAMLSLGRSGSLGYVVDQHQLQVNRSANVTEASVYNERHRCHSNIVHSSMPLSQNHKEQPSHKSMIQLPSLQQDIVFIPRPEDRNLSTRPFSNGSPFVVSKASKKNGWETQSEKEVVSCMDRMLQGK